METNEIKILNPQDVEIELNKSAIEHRDADFSGKILPNLSLAERHLDYGLNLNNATIAGNVFLADLEVNGNVNFENAAIMGSMFLGGEKLSAT